MRVLAAAAIVLTTLLLCLAGISVMVATVDLASRFHLKRAETPPSLVLVKGTEHGESRAGI